MVYWASPAFGLAMVPMQAPALAVKEMERAAKRPSMRGLYVATNMNGADRVVLGSDYCFDMGLMDPVGTVERLSALSEGERDLILGTTAGKLLRL